MDTLSISLVVLEVIYEPCTYIHKEICYSGKFAAYLDVHLVHMYIYICMYLCSILIYEPSQKNLPRRLLLLLLLLLLLPLLLHYCYCYCHCYYCYYELSYYIAIFLS